MTPILETSTTFRVCVTAAAPAASLAILSIASILGIEPQQAADRMASLPTVLAENVAPPVARRASALLSALGLQVRLDPTLSPARADEAVVDVALQPAGPVRPEVQARVAGLLDLPADALHVALALPGGLVLHGQTPERVARLRRALRRVPTVRLMTSAPPTATYDAFRLPGVPCPTAELARLGLGICARTGAVATAMNRPTAEHIARRTEGRLMIVDRAFQRYDLHLRAVPGGPTAELERFLASRPCGQNRRGPDGARIVDADLPYRTALQFAADYAAIGLDVTLALRGLRPETA